MPDHTHHSQPNMAASPFTSDDVLEVKDLTVTMKLRQGTIRPVDGVTLSLKRGEILGLVGESGCGKTTVALAVAALLPRFATITGGQILLNGQDLAALKRSEMRTVRGAKIGTVFQDPMSSLDPCFRVGDQITEAVRAHGRVSRADADAKAVAMLQTVGMPDPARQMRAYPHELSGGMRQRVGLAIALVADPIVLVADEPTTALDVTLQKQILRLLKHLRSEFGFSAIFITHDLAVVDEVADRVAVMYCGQIVESGPVDDVLQDPRHPYTQGLLRSMPGLATPGHDVPVIGGEVPDMLKLPGGCRFQPRCPNRVERCAESVPELGPIGGTANFAATTPPCFLGDGMTMGAGQDPVLSAHDLSKSFVTRRDLFGRPAASFSALKGVNLSLFRGETVALVGESGSGKSTLARCMLRLVQPSSGSVMFGEVDVLNASRPQLQDFRQHVQIVFQDPFGSLDPRLRIGTSIAEGMRHLGLTSAQSRARCMELLELVQLPPRALDRYPHEFSGGQRQRISIARALGPDPSILLADEPVSALDVSVQGTILNLLRDLQDKLGLTYLIITHDLSVVRNISDRVAVMYQGALVEDAPADEFFEHPQHPHSRELIAAAPSLELRSRLHTTRQGEQPSRQGGTTGPGEEP